MCWMMQYTRTRSVRTRVRVCAWLSASQSFSAPLLPRADCTCLTLSGSLRPLRRGPSAHRGGADSGIFRKRHGPPTDPIQPHAQAFHAFLPVLSRRMPRHVLPAFMDVVNPYSSLAPCACFRVQFAVALSMSLLVRRCLCVPLCGSVCLSAPPYV